MKGGTVTWSPRSLHLQQGERPTRLARDEWRPNETQHLLSTLVPSNEEDLPSERWTLEMRRDKRVHRLTAALLSLAPPRRPSAKIFTAASACFS